MSDNKDRSRRSDVWKFFEVTDANHAMGKQKVTCQLCRIELTYSGGSTGTMKNHLKFKHSSVSLSSTSGSTIASKSSGCLPKQMTLNAYRSPVMSNDKWCKCTKKLAAMCARDLRPLGIVDGDGFKEFINEVNPSYTIPSRPTVSKYLNLVYEEGKQDLISVIKKQSQVALTTDMWTSKATEGYLTLTLHYIDTNWDYNNVVLATREMDERHTGVNMANEIRKICEEFGVELNRVSALVSDNASNMTVCAAELNVPHHRCFGHTLQLSITGAFEKIPIVKRTITSAKHLVSHFRRSVVASNTLSKYQKQMNKPENTLIIDCATRWNSTYDMFERLLQQRLPIFNVLHDEHVTSLSEARTLDLSDKQWSIMESLVPILKPLYMATRIMCSEEYPTFSGVYPVLFSLTLRHLQHTSDDSSEVVCFKNYILDDINARFRLKDDDLFSSSIIISSFLDPRYKTLPFLSEEQRGNVQRNVISLLGKIDLESKGGENSSSPTSYQSHSDSHVPAGDSGATALPVEEYKCARGKLSQSDVSFLLGDFYAHESVSEKPANPCEEVAAYTILECRVCNEVFRFQGEKVPRLLMCGHTVCHQCLSRLQVHDRAILCPFDRQPTDIGDSGVWGLKKNFALLELLEKLQFSVQMPTRLFSDAALNREKELSIPCDENEQHTGVVFCTTCSTNLCLECSEVTHSTKTLARHKRVPISEKPRENPKCIYHPMHLVEFVCMEEECQTTPLMCYICKDYGRHVKHGHALLEIEAENVRSSILNAVQHIRSFGEEVSDSARKLGATIQQIEGGVQIVQGMDGMSATQQVPGTADQARLKIKQYFNDLRDNLNRQEVAALTTVDTHIREKLCMLRQQQEDIAVLLSQISAICHQCEIIMQKDDAKVLIAKPEVNSLFQKIQIQQQQFSEIPDQSHLDPAIPITFTKDSRVHIGPKIEMRVVILGLDDSGKTSILFKLKQNEFIQTIPTIGFNVETVEYKNFKFTIWDVGGQTKIRPLWKHYYFNTQAVIFVVDSSNTERLPEAHAELVKVLQEKELKEASLLMFINKQDISPCLSIEEISERFGLFKLCCNRSWHIQGCDAASGNGLHDGLEWLSRQMVAAGAPELA